MICLGGKEDLELKMMIMSMIGRKRKERKARSGASLSYLHKKSPYKEKISNNDSSYRQRLRSSGSNSGESLEVQATTSESVLDDAEDLPQDSSQSSKDLKAYRHLSPYRKSVGNQRHDSPNKRSMDNQRHLYLSSNRRSINSQMLSSPNKRGSGNQTLPSPNKKSMDKQRQMSPNRRSRDKKTMSSPKKKNMDKQRHLSPNRSTGKQMLASPNRGSMEQRRGSYESDRNYELDLNNRESLNNTENARRSVSRSSDKALQDQNEKKAHSEREKQLTRKSSIEQNVLDKDVSEGQTSESEEEESTGERKESLSESRPRADVPPGGTSDEEEAMEEAADGDVEQDVTMNDMLQDNISHDKSIASVMIRSSIQDTPVTNWSPKNLNKRRLINKINDDKGKDDDDDDDNAREKNDDEKEDEDDASVQATSSEPSLPKQKKISFSSETKNPEKEKRARYVHKVELWQGEMEKRPKRSALDLDIVFNHLDKEMQQHVSRGKDNLNTIQRKECHLLSRVRKSIINTIEAVEDVRQKRSDILRTKRNIKDYRTELTELQQRNIRLSEKLENKENEKKYRKKLLSDWISDFENLMLASRKIKSKTTTKDMVVFGYQPNIKCTAFMHLQWIISLWQIPGHLAT
ncbi:serine/arginine repetitive matrix protein 5-like [Pecten maximus]|uniref:serine/arginine repetitive matrix protein 5-like n=1 Tax=Pecten maximus TaxID=6579 RepID=UPI0014585592|nr:serine/arginine repetitive matrix protein 5-like [Pecten maximus]